MANEHVEPGLDRGRAKEKARRAGKKVAPISQDLVVG
jgi:hypothetical protein